MYVSNPVVGRERENPLYDDDGQHEEAHYADVRFTDNEQSFGFTSTDTAPS
jgi:hypothetical protein